jgi:hypothetical protein
VEQERELDRARALPDIKRRGRFGSLEQEPNGAFPLQADLGRRLLRM